MQGLVAHLALEDSARTCVWLEKQHRITCWPQNEPPAWREHNGALLPFRPFQPDVP